jgi:hypothetical protein
MGKLLMVDATFKSDSSFAARYAGLARTLPSLGLPFGLMIYSHAAIGWIVFAGAIAALLVAAQALRLVWGDQVTIAGNSLAVFRQGRLTKSVTSDTITAAIVNAKTLLVAWDEAGKRRSIFIPQESFTSDSFQKLTHAFLMFVPSEKLKRRDA